MIVMLVLPEWVVWHAYAQWTQACSDVASNASSGLFLFPHIPLALTHTSQDEFTNIERTEIYGMMKEMDGIQVVNKGDSKTMVQAAKNMSNPPW